MTALAPRPQAALSTQIQVSGDGRLGKLRFFLAFRAGKELKVLQARLLLENAPVPGLDELSQAFRESGFSFDTPDAIRDFELVLTQVGFRYAFEDADFTFTLAVRDYGSLSVNIASKGSGRTYRFVLQIDAVVPLSALPLIGDGAGAADRIELEQFSVGIGADKQLQPGAKFALCLAGQLYAIDLPGGVAPQHENALMDAASAVKWVDLNKDIGPAHIARLGFELGDGRIAVYVDAGLRLSILLLEVMGLHVSIPLKKGEAVEFGIQGAAISVARDPLYIAGALSIAEEDGITLYTGSLSVRFQTFQFTALGSYGKLPGGEASFFAFALLRVPLGGPPIFYVTGLAGGFGYNRTLLLPSDVHKVKAFPFVAAALGKGTLTDKMTPAMVLRAMDASIRPKAGQYFASAGIEFSSFGVLSSFLLLSILFGERLEISMLGVSTLSMPPKSDSPFVYAELSLLAVIAPGDGIVSVLGALSSESFLLDKRCKLRGGFAFVTWFGDHEHSGDFVLTLGGYSDKFSVAHYPKVDRIGVDWQISDHLQLTASFYFALTPNCVMMGGSASITYELGRLRAWFRARLEFSMKWKPFAYEFSVSVSVGASFRWDFFPFYRTFSVELGAGLSCWGPPFSGTVYVSWFIISFTISFGGGRPKSDPLTWDQFADAFLAKAAPGGKRKLLTILAAGTVGDSRARQDCAPRYGVDGLALEVRGMIPSTAWRHGNQAGGDPVYGGESLGVVPMGMEQLESELNLSLTDAQGRAVELLAAPILGNLPRALWHTQAPGGYDANGLKRGRIVGVRLSVPPPSLEGVLPQSDAFSLAVLCEHERLRHGFDWTNPVRVEPGSYPGDVLSQIEASIGQCARRDDWLCALSRDYGVASAVDVGGWTSHLEDVLLAEPALSRIGAGAV